MNPRSPTAAERARIAKALGLRPSAAEEEAGIASAAACVFAADLVAEEWRVVDVRGAKHRVPATKGEMSDDQG